MLQRPPQRLAPALPHPAAVAATAGLCSRSKPLLVRAQMLPGWQHKVCVSTAVGASRGRSPAGRGSDSEAGGGAAAAADVGATVDAGNDARRDVLKWATDSWEEDHKLPWNDAGERRQLLYGIAGDGESHCDHALQLY